MADREQADGTNVPQERTPETEQPRGPEDVAAEQAGARRFRFHIAPRDDERIPENNVQDMLIHVRDAREKILYFEGEPRFEMKFLRRAIEDDERMFAAWMHRKPSVHDVAFTLGASPRLHHTGFFVPEQHHISRLCDVFGALELQHHIERGPGRHGVSNAFYLSGLTSANITLSAADMLAWNSPDEIHINNCGLTAANVTQAILGAWGLRNLMGHSTPVLNIGGASNAVPGGAYADEDPPTTDLGYIYELVNDPEGEGFYKWAVVWNGGSAP